MPSGLRTGNSLGCGIRVLGLAGLLSWGSTEFPFIIQQPPLFLGLG